MHRRSKLILSLSTIYFIGLVAGQLHPGGESFAWEWMLIAGISVGIIMSLIVSKLFEELDNGRHNPMAG